MTTIDDPVAAQAAPPAPSRTGRNVAALTGGQVFTWTMTFVWTLVVPRALGPEGMGIVVSGWAVAGIFGIVLGLGTRTYLTREMVVEPGESSHLVGTALSLRVAMAPLFVVGVVVYARLADYGSEGTAVLYLAAGATFLTLLAEPMQAAFQAVERMEYLAYSDVINKSAQGLLGVVLALLGFRSVGITACWMVVAGVVVVVDALWLRQFVRVDLRTNVRRMVDMAHKSLAYWAFGLFFLIYLWIDSVMLSLMTRAEVVGWYGVPTKLFQTLLFLAVIISTAWFPRLVGAHLEGRRRLVEVARVPMELVIVLSLPICAAAASTARPVIHLLYGSAYDNAAPVMAILSFCIPLMYVNIMMSQVLVAAKRQAVWTAVIAGATVVNPLVNLGLIRLADHRWHNGAIGAALSLVATEVLIVGAGAVLIGRDILDWKGVKRCLRAAAASALLAGAALAAQPYGLAASVVAGGVTFVVAALLLRVATRQELEVLRRAAGRVTARVPVLGRRLAPPVAELAPEQLP